MNNKQHLQSLQKKNYFKALVTFSYFLKKKTNKQTVSNKKCDCILRIFSLFEVFQRLKYGCLIRLTTLAEEYMSTLRIRKPMYKRTDIN